MPDSYDCVCARQQIISGVFPVQRANVDHSAKPRVSRANGRQADRRKVCRAPEDVIRVRVVEEPIVSDADFARVQALLEEKRRRFWRSRPENANHARFVYRGFLICAECGSPYYVHVPGKGKDYYVCKRRMGRVNGARCTAPYMSRRLHGILDEIFVRQLTDPNFLRERFEELRRRNEARSDHRQIARLENETKKLSEKRTRVLGNYEEGLIDREARDVKISTVDRDLSIARSALLELSATPAFQVSPEQIAAIFDPFFQWETLAAEDQRIILSTMAPEIRVADYQIKSVSVIAPAGSGSKVALESALGRGRRWVRSGGDYKSRSRTAPLPSPGRPCR